MNEYETRRCRDCKHCEIDFRLAFGNGALGWCRLINASINPMTMMPSDPAVLAWVVSYTPENCLWMRVAEFSCILWEPRAQEPEETAA